MQQTKYDKIVKLSNNYIAVRKGYRWGLFDNEGTPLMNIIYDYISYDTENDFVILSDYLNEFLNDDVKITIVSKEEY